MKKDKVKKDKIKLEANYGTRRKKNLFIEVLPDKKQDGEKMVCELTAISVRHLSPSLPRGLSYRVRVRSAWGKPISGYRSIGGRQQYKLMNKIHNSRGWRINKINKSIISTPENLINEKISISNEYGTFTAKIVNAYFASGTKGPATGDGLPPIDE